MTTAAALRAAPPQRRWADELGIAAVLCLLAVTLALGGWAWRLDRVVYDFGLLLWRRPAPADIIIVAIDDASIDAIGRWPWRRAVHATLLQQLAQARPRAVALDLVLSEPDPDPAQDRLLAAALQKAAPVVVPVGAAVALGASTSAPAPASTLALAVLEPTPELRRAVRLGAADAAVDADGVLRSAFLHAGPPGAPYPHLALALLQAGGETMDPRLQLDHESASEGSINGSRRPGWQRDGRFLIRYAGPPGTVEQVSYVDVLRGAVPAARLAGRYVLVGMTAQGLGDTLATPVNGSHRAMSGVEVHANTLYTLRSGDAVHALSERSVAALSALLLLALVLSFGRFGPRRALPTAVVSVPLAVAVSLLALNVGWWCSPVPFALAAALAYPLWSWRRLERAVAGLDQEIARFDFEADERGARTAAHTTARTPARTPVAAAGSDAIETRLLALQRAGTLQRQARRFLADSLAAMPTAMLVADERAAVVLANSRAATVFDVQDAAELHGLDLLRLLTELGTAANFDWRTAVATLQPGQAGLAVEARLAGGGDCVVHLAAVDLHGLRRLIVTLADVEPVKQAQREREEALAFVSHDLRSPVTSIVLLAELELQGAAQTPRDELLREMRRLATRTLELSEAFVRAAQAQSQPLARAPASTLQLVEEALADLRAQATAAGITLHSAGTDASVAVDRLLVVRAIANLVSNAIKHSPRGTVVEVVSTVQSGVQGAVHGAVQDAVPGAQWALQVRDHGPGLSAAQMAQLARGDEGAAVHDARGVGLGLLFVQRVARRHGGTLHAARPVSGSGVVFELVLPLQV